MAINTIDLNKLTDGEERPFLMVNGGFTVIKRRGMSWVSDTTGKYDRNGVTQANKEPLHKVIRQLPDLLHDKHLGKVYWLANGWRARIEVVIPTSEKVEAVILREDGSIKCTTTYNKYGQACNMVDGYDMMVDASHLPYTELHTDGAVHKFLASPIEAIKLGDADIVAHGTAATAGHLACQGGLRGHSVGDEFPYIPFFKGPDFEQYVRTPNGIEYGPFDSLEAMRKVIHKHIAFMQD